MMKETQHYNKWRPHPWHGLDSGKDAPRIVRAYIEMTPFDLIKYEVDKHNGCLQADRPQETSSLPPCLYGFVPQTYCDRRVAMLCEDAQEGDGDPLDICVVSERPINRAEISVTARVIGVLQTIDQGKADDKIIGVLDSDPFWSDTSDISELADIITNRIKHYFSTYKTSTDSESRVKIRELLGREYALKIVQAAMDDYQAEYKSTGRGKRMFQ
jgi:inorganic pyrophosphatase